MARQYLAAGCGFLNETRTSQYMAAGMGFVNETQVYGSTFTTSGTGTLAAVGSGAIGASFNMSGVGAFSAVGPSNQGSFTMAGTGAFAGVGRGAKLGSFVMAGTGSFSAAGQIAPQNNSFLVAGAGVINETTRRQYIVAGGYFINENQPNGHAFVASGLGELIGVGKALAKASFNITGTGSLSGVGNIRGEASFAIGGSGQVQGSSSFILVTDSYYENLDDVFNFLSLTRSQAVLSSFSSSGSGSFSAVGTSIVSTSFMIAGVGSVNGITSTPTAGQFDFSTPINSLILPSCM